MTKRKYREMVAAIILSVCVSMGAAPIDSLAAGGQIMAFGESQDAQNTSGGKDSGKTEACVYHRARTGTFACHAPEIQRIIFGRDVF